MTNNKPTNFTLMVSKSPFDHRNAENALAFCHAAMEQGHKINQVFFYQSGTHNASHLQLPNNDEVHVHRQWLALHQKYKIPLNVCVTAASRRGVVDETFVDNGAANLKSPFSQVGLSAYFETLTGNSVNIQL